MNPELRAPGREPGAGPGCPIASLLAPVWRVTLGDPEVCVAVLDGPVDLSHPCFRGAAIAQVGTLVEALRRPGPQRAKCHVGRRFSGAAP
jgi:hypothetical protein